jgi:hypothetical protein
MKSHVWVLGLTLVVTATAHADTLVLKNGRRVQGALVGVAGTQVEFEDRSGVWRRVLRIGREEIARIEFGNGRRRDGPAGEANSPSNHLRPIPDRPAAALIGKIGDREDVFFIGADSGPFRARESGRLYLGINDDWLEDNTGSLRVNVHY